jgi:glycosyltransferase involved in cell wall biosynthesis
MRVLVITAMYPTEEKPSSGTFVKDQVDSLREAGVDVDVFAFDSHHAAINYLKAGITLRHILNKKDYDLVHAHYGLTGAIAIMQKTCPVVITYHGSDLLGGFGVQKRYTLSGKIVTMISKAAAIGAAQCIVVADLLKPKIRHKSIETIPMGVDLSLFKPTSKYEARRRLGYTDDKYLILFAADPKNPVKRFDIAYEAVNLLQKKAIDVELVPLYNKPHDVVPLYMNACDVLVLTSMHEASPCVIKEAMACNLPVVSVDVGDVAERIEGVKGCFLCERVASDIADKLRLALENGRCSEGRNKICALSLPNIATRLVNVYDKVKRVSSLSNIM